ncbi:MAG: hypothetical protein QNJ63_30490 [Calothrix sp. MO_192.B10]|nr:hypothetical protein [Calothrix sp. MO_192.B10]
MSKQIQSNKTELFVALPEKEQESAAGGFSVRFGMSDILINSHASNNVSGSISNAAGNVSFSDRSQSSYALWQSTKVVEFDFGSYYSRPGRKVPFLDLLSRFVFYFFSSF